MCGIICSLNELTPRQLTLSGVYFIYSQCLFSFQYRSQGKSQLEKRSISDLFYWRITKIEMEYDNDMKKRIQFSFSRVKCLFLYLTFAGKDQPWIISGMCRIFFLVL